MTSEKNLGVKIVTKEHQIWLNIKESLEKEALNLKAQIELNNYMLPYVNKKVEEFEK